MLPVRTVEMYLKSREELESFSEAYDRRPELRRGIRLTLNGNAADILLIIYWRQGKARTLKVVEKIANRNGGPQLLTDALHELLRFSHFGDWEVRRACENTAYLIAAALDWVWNGD